MLDIRLLAASCQLQNATKYCIKVLKRVRLTTESNNSATVYPRIINKVCRDIQAYLVYSLMDMTSPATSDRHLWNLKKRSTTMPLSTASGRISGERFKRGARNFTCLSWTASLTKLPDRTSLAASGRLKMKLNFAPKCI